MKYDVFISYSRDDSVVAERICRVLDKVGISYYIDRNEIKGGQNFPEELVKAIVNSRIFLYLASENSYEGFARKELEFVCSDSFTHVKKYAYVIDDSTIPPAIRLLLGCITWSRLTELPIEPNLIDDLTSLLGREQLPIFRGKKVDLGLSVCWADCNVGASSIEGYGDYFAWGEVETKNAFLEKNYTFYNVSKDSYMDIGEDISKSKYDVAKVKWRGDWRMPTKREVEELCQKCAWLWTDINGVKGQQIIGPSGNSIFLPAVGFHRGIELLNQGICGDYWSATAPREPNENCAYNLHFYVGYRDWDFRSRCNGRAIRPVCD